jgi:DNA-binding response OmpR family regulator
MARILVVDDERLVCDLLKTLLSTKGHEVLTAYNGTQAVELFRQRQPHFTLLDLRMPGKHGIEVLKEIRQINSEAAVMIMTAWGSDDLESQARALGVTEFLNKGLSLEVLMSAMKRAMEPGRGNVTPGSAHAPAETSKGTAETQPEGEQKLYWREAARNSILVVDDEPLIRNLLEQFLSLRDYRVRTASDGVMALDMIEQEHPQFIVLDMYMPRMNGVEVLRALKAKNYQGRVLALTASQDQEMLQEVRALGTIDILGKPVDLERLALAIQVGGAFDAPGKASA